MGQTWMGPLGYQAQSQALGHSNQEELPGPPRGEVQLSQHDRTPSLHTGSLPQRHGSAGQSTAPHC